MCDKNVTKFMKFCLSVCLSVCLSFLEKAAQPNGDISRVLLFLRASGH